MRRQRARADSVYIDLSSQSHESMSHTEMRCVEVRPSGYGTVS